MKSSRLVLGASLSLIGLFLIVLGWVGATNEVRAGVITVGNFSIVYDFTNYANCSPECKDVTILYDSSNNELTYINNLDVREAVNISHLDDKQERILQEAVPHLRYLNYTDNTCKIRQPYCIASKLTVTGDFNIGSRPHTTSSEWSFLSTDIVNNAQRIANTLLPGGNNITSIR